jgi:hypothetical protein
LTYSKINITPTHGFGPLKQLQDMVRQNFLPLYINTPKPLYFTFKATFLNQTLSPKQHASSITQ